MSDGIKKSWKLKIIGGLASILLLFLVFSFYFLMSQDAVIFQSLESKNDSNGPVFNQIKYIYGWNQDIWLLHQSYEGASLDISQWERFAIIVDKTKSPSEAIFYQLEHSKELNMEGNAMPFRARCFRCHANGPRAIRMDEDRPEISPTIWQRAQIAMWNLRIKTYGQVVGKAGVVFNEGAPFRATQSDYARPLGLESCKGCHSSQGIRHELKMEHLGTAHFLVKNGKMPPFPFSIPPEDVEKLNQMFEAKSRN